MKRKTESESLFEAFCDHHCLSWSLLDTGQNRTPDYHLTIEADSFVFEIKQIEGCDFEANGVMSRTVGQHIRQKIAGARKQLQPASLAGTPTVLLIYNALDLLQLFGTEPHDFICAMYGDLTVRIRQGHIGDSFHGRNSSLRKDMNTSFSAVGHLRRKEDGAEVLIYENIFARHPLPFDKLPQCIGAIRIEVENAA